MVIYEVNISAEEEIAAEYFTWLKDHVHEMLTLPGFRSARIYQPEGTSRSSSWTVHYFMESRAHLEEYFAGHALEMREKGIKAFGNRFSASRRILNPLHSSDKMATAVD